MIIRKIIFAALLSTLGSLAFAGKVAVLDHEQAIKRTKKAESYVNSLTSRPEFEKLRVQIETLQADLRALTKEEQTKGMTWSKEQQAEHEKKKSYIQADLKLAGQKIQAEQNVIANKLMQEVAPKLSEVIKKIADSEGIDVVLQARAAYYAKPDIDITEKVAKELDKTL